jgi:putative phosphoesterase
MKIGVISDIHGHLAPLEKALILLDRLGVDQIVCAGDVVGEGYEGDAVVKLLQERQILSVLGNHDEEAFADQAWLRRHQRSLPDSPNRLLLDSRTVAYVSSMPLTLSFEWEGTSICLAHGTPRNNKIYVFPMTQTRRDATRLRSAHGIYQDMLRSTIDEIIVLGHTHIPMCMIINGVWVVNPGSVSRNRTDDGSTCGVLSLPDRHFEVYDLNSSEPISIDRRQWQLTI